MDKILSNPIALLLLCILIGSVLGLAGYVYLGITGDWENLWVVRRWKNYSRGLLERRYQDVIKNPWVKEDERLEELSEKVAELTGKKDGDDE